jgi:hypothetical protein
VTGEAVPAGLRIESVPTPRKPTGFETTEQAHGTPVPGHRVDARSETGAGVGLASQRLPTSGRGRWLLIGGVAVLALGLGLVVPPLFKASPGEAAPASSPGAGTGASAAAMVPPLPSPVVTLVTPSASGGDVGGSSGNAGASASVSARAGGGVGAGGSGGHPGPARPRGSATASAPPPPTTAAKPPAGSDDDIK